jgi:hypothetical protein
MVMQQPFTTTSPILANYDWGDVSEGFGYVDYYPYFTSLDPATYSMANNKVYSHTIGTTRSSGGTTTLTFTSSSFNLPRSIKGKAIFQCGVGAAAPGTTITVTAKLQKWDGTTATDITSEVSSVALAVTSENMMLLELTTTETVVAVGESLRLIVKFTTPGVVAGYLGHDPMGRTFGTIGTTGTTEMRISIPFKIDL